MKVKDVMTKEVTSVLPETNTCEVLELLQKMRISGLPVIDKDNRLAGMFTEKDVLSYILPSYIEKVGRFIYQADPKAVKQKILDLRNMKVKDVMRHEVVVVDEDTVLYEAARIMLTQKARRLPVLDTTKQVVGIVSRGDIVKALFKKYG